MINLLEELKTQSNLPQIIEEINSFWKKEQQKRKEFYEIEKIKIREKTIPEKN